jgi:hypothetical protein
VRRDIVTEPEERISENIVVDHVVTEDGLRMRVRCVFALFNVDPAAFDRNVVHNSEPRAAGDTERFAAAKVRFLRRERVPVDRRLDRSSDPGRQLQAGQRCTLIEEVLDREIREPEVLPPH